MNTIFKYMGKWSLPFQNLSADKVKSRKILEEHKLKSIAEYVSLKYCGK